MTNQYGSSQKNIRSVFWPQAVVSQHIHIMNQMASIAGHGIQNGVGHRENDAKKKCCKKTMNLKARTDNPRSDVHEDYVDHQVEKSKCEDGDRNGDEHEQRLEDAVENGHHHCHNESIKKSVHFDPGNQESSNGHCNGRDDHVYQEIHEVVMD